MIHENWIPIEMFDKEKHQGELMLFAEFGGVIPWFHAGEWDRGWKKFWNGDVTFEPTHYLNPTCYKKESL